MMVNMRTGKVKHGGEVTMNARERFHAMMQFGQTDRLPFWLLESITEQAVRSWCGQGMPQGVEITEYIGVDPLLQVHLSADPIPNFVAHTIDADERFVTAIDRYGFTVKTLKQERISPTCYYYIKGSVENRSDWEAMKKRYDPSDIRRFGPEWSPELLDYYRNASCPVTLVLPWGPGRGIKNGYMLGLEGFLDKVMNEPVLLEDMFEFWADFLIRLTTPLLEQVPIDLLFIDEDGIAFRNGPIVSPEIYRKIWIPPMRRFVEHAYAHGVRFVGQYTAGHVAPLIPALMSIGVNLFAPLEVAADMDARTLRKEYGRDLLLMGNIGRGALMGGIDAIDRELDAKTTWLVEQRGFIPAVDDQILPDITFDSYMHYVNRIKSWKP